MQIAIVGGGGFRVPLLHTAFARSDLDVTRFVLYDPSPGRLQVIRAVLGDPSVLITTDLDEALDGADLVLSALRVGGLSGRVQDERTAQDLGLLGQETVGAGGIAYALRGVPVAINLAEAIARRAPGAWTISMTNPAGVVVEAMNAVLGDRVIGVCDSPVGLVRRAAEAAGLPDTGVHQLDVDYVGLNHLGWLRALARPGGPDVVAALLADPAALATFEEGRLFGPNFLAALGSLPNEYLYYFYDARRALAAVRAAAQTRGEQIQDTQRAFYAAAMADPGIAPALWHAANRNRNETYLAELRVGSPPRAQADVEHGGYETVALALARALSGGPATRLILNVANGTTVPELAADAVIEAVCTVDQSGAHPLAVAALGEHQLGLVCAVKASERAAIEAARTGSLVSARRAFALHPLCGSLSAADQLARRWHSGLARDR